MIEAIDHARRRWLGALALGVCLPGAAWASQGRTTRLLAAWQAGDGQCIGLIDLPVGEVARVAQSLVVPTRAHGLLVEAGGSVLAMARRPGDWLLRWHPATGATQWHWIEDDQRFNGHVVASARDPMLWTTETDRESGEGRVALRDAHTLARTAAFATHGMDPHELLVLPARLGDVPAGSLLVANGGIPTQPETGRAKRDLDRMDASLVALDQATGQLLGQWRLSDPRLSIRHLAWDPVSGRVGIALQAEHDDAAARQAAPLLAVWDGRSLQAAREQPALAGYGGDICARPGGGFLVSATRSHQVAWFDARAVWQRSEPLQEACALGATGGGWWAAGRARGLSNFTRDPLGLPEGLRLDNHWRVVEDAAGPVRRL